MSKYLKIFISFAKNCFMGEMEFRVNFLAWIFINIFWVFISIVIVDLFYGQVDTIAGWTKNETLVLVSFFNIFIGLMWIFFLPNIVHFHRLTKTGEFDFVLLKPVDSRFWVSTRTIEFDSIPRTFLSIGMVIFYFQTLGIATNPIFVINSIFVALASLLIFYNLYFMLMTTNFWFINLFNIENIVDSFNDMGRYPVQIFQGALRVVFFYIIPLGFIATFPAEVLMGRNIGFINILMVILLVTTFTISQWFWNFAIKRYSSASS